MPPEPDSKLAIPVVTAQELLERPDAVVVDLRTPDEFAEDHVPGALNVPLLSNEGRALVGFLYKRDSPASAFREGRELVLQRVEGLVREIAERIGWQAPEVDLAERVEGLTSGGIQVLEDQLVAQKWSLPDQPVVLHCWRGGLRSRSVVALLRGLGLERASGLQGGYRSYREQVREELDTAVLPQAFVLRGLTGVGKTLVLREIERLRPGWTVDLEGCAGHRSSLLGMVGLEPVTQKAFDSALGLRLRAGVPGPVVYEGESRKVGDVVIPTSVWESMQSAVNLELVAPVERRVDVLLEDYLARPEARDQLRVQLALVEGRMSGRFGLVELLDSGQERELVRLLLEHYYDPLYKRSEKGKAYAVTMDTTDPAAAAVEVVRWIEGRAVGHRSPGRE